MRKFLYGFFVSLVLASAAVVVASPQIQPLDMQGFKIFNLATGTAPADAVRFDQLPSSSSPLSPTSGGTGQSAVAQGDLLYGSATNVWSRLAKSTSADRLVCNTGTSNSPAWCQADLTKAVTNTLPAGNGGTGQSSYTSGDILTATGATTLSKLAKGSANQVLGMNSGATTQEYKTIGVGTSGSDFNIANSANAITLNLPDASGSNRGVVTTGAQTFAGNKTLSGTTNLSGLTASRPLSLDGSKNIVNTAYDLTSANFATAAWSTWSPSYSASGSMTYTSVTTAISRYITIGKLTCAILRANGTTGGTASDQIIASLPVAVATIGATIYFPVIQNDSSTVVGMLALASGSSNALFLHTSGNWSLGANRAIYANFCYESA